MRGDLLHLQRRIEACLPVTPEEVHLRFRSMFGGLGGYASDVMFASLSDVGLGLKLSPADQTELLCRPGVKRLQYGPSAPPSKQYLVVPLQVLDSDHELREWLARSLEYARHLPVKPRKPKR